MKLWWCRTLALSVYVTHWWSGGFIRTFFFFKPIGFNIAKLFWDVSHPCCRSKYLDKSRVYHKVISFFLAGNSVWAVLFSCVMVLLFFLADPVLHVPCLLSRFPQLPFSGFASAATTLTSCKPFLKVPQTRNTFVSGSVLEFEPYLKACKPFRSKHDCVLDLMG